MKRISGTIFSLLMLMAIAGGAQDDPRELYKKGVEYNKNGEFAKAIEYYTKAIKIKRSPEIYFVRGRAYRQNNQLNESIQDFTRALALKPNYAEVYNQRGVSYIGKGQMNLAEADFKKACALGHEDACRNLKRLNSR